MLCFFAQHLFSFFFFYIQLLNHQHFCFYPYISAESAVTKVTNKLVTCFEPSLGNNSLLKFYDGVLLWLSSYLSKFCCCLLLVSYCCSAHLFYLHILTLDTPLLARVSNFDCMLYVSICAPELPPDSRPPYSPSKSLYLNTPICLKFNILPTLPSLPMFPTLMSSIIVHLCLQAENWTLSLTLPSSSHVYVITHQIEMILLISDFPNMDTFLHYFYCSSCLPHLNIQQQS